jgi:hypothetical protein
VVLVSVSGSRWRVRIRAAAEGDELSALEHAVEDDLGQIVVVQHLAALAQLLVGGEDHGLLREVAPVDDAEEQVGGIGSVVEVTDLVDDQHVRLDPRRRRVTQAACARGFTELVDERAGGHEARGKAVLDGAVADRDGEVRLAAPRRPRQDDVAAFRDELWAEVGSELLALERGLEEEVEVLDGLDERKLRLARGSRDTRVVAVRHFLRHE